MSEAEEQPPALALHGIVLSVAGRRVNGAEVLINESDAQPAATTDVRGFFDIQELPAATRTLFVRHADYVAKLVPVREAAASGETLEITLRRGATLTGTVTSLGRPLANHEVKSNDSGSWFFGRESRVARTDGRGVYKFAHLRSGRYSPVCFLHEDDGESAPRKLTVDAILEDEKTTVANFEFREWNASLEGRILFNGQPAQDAYVEAVCRTEDEARESFQERADADGYYRFDILPSGTLDVAIRMRVGTAELQRTTVIEIPAGVVTTRDFAFGGAGAISGYCLGLDEHGGQRNRISKPEVVLLKGDICDSLAEVGLLGTEMMTNMDAALHAYQEVAEDGSFRMDNLEEGAYTVILVADIGLNSPLTYAFSCAAVSGAQETEIILGPDFVTEYAEPGEK